MEQADDSFPLVTIGHSNRDFSEFSALIGSHAVEKIIDVRRYPNSRRHPQFNEGNLVKPLEDEGIDYEHWPEIGGYRNPVKNSSNTALDGGFRGVADHLNTESGQRALDQLEEVVESLPDGSQLVLLCAEKDPQRCHRKLISDHLTVRGIKVRHLIEEDVSREHELHPNARPADGTVVYPGLL